MQHTKNLQAKIKVVEEEKNALLTSLVSEREKAKEKDKRNKKVVKFAKKKLNVKINTITEEGKKYYLSIAKFKNCQGFRLRWSEHGLTKDHRKYENLNA